MQDTKQDTMQEQLAKAARAAKREQEYKQALATGEHTPPDTKSKRLDSTIKALKSEAVPVTGQGKTLRAKPSSSSLRGGKFYKSRTAPAEMYLLDSCGQRNARNRIKPEQVRYAFRYILEGMSWHGEVPKDMYWLYELGLRSVLRWRDSSSPLQRARYKRLLDAYKESGGVSWSSDKQGRVKFSRQQGFCSDTGLIERYGDKRTNGAYFNPEDYGAGCIRCKHCDKPVLIDACTGNKKCCYIGDKHSYCGSSIYGTPLKPSLGRQYYDLITKDKALAASPGKRMPRYSEQVLSVGRQLQELVQAVPGAKELLERKRVPRPKRSNEPSTGLSTELSIESSTEPETSLGDASIGAAKTLDIDKELEGII